MACTTGGIIGNCISNNTDANATDHVNIPNSSSLNVVGSLSLEAWVYSTYNASNRGIINKNEVNSYNLTCSYGLMAFWVGGTHIKVLNSINTGQWYHVVGVYDAPNQSAYVYVNGVNQPLFAGSVNYPFVPPTFTGGTDPVWLGNWQLIGTNPWVGSLDECVIYNIALNPAQILFRYNNGAGTEQPIFGAETQTSQILVF